MININFPILKFNKHKVILQLKPILNKIINCYQFDFGCIYYDNYSYTEFLGDDNISYFSPWFKTYDKFKGETYINETKSFQGNESPLIYKKSDYGKYIMVSNDQVFSWVGYFDRIMEANREYKQNGIKNILDTLYFHGIYDNSIITKVKEFKIRK